MFYLPVGPLTGGNPRMERPRHPRPRRLGRRLRQRRGVAAAIGTLLALLVFMSLFGLFVTQFVPLWMMDNEASFTSSVQAEFGSLQQNLDLLALDAAPGRSLSGAVTMQSGNVPILAQPTQGILSYTNEPALYTNVSFNLTGLAPPTGVGEHNFYQNFTSGEISMQIPNRYYVPTYFGLSDGAVVAQQSSGSSTMLFSPGFEGTLVGSTTSLYLTLFQVLGNNTQTTSTGTQQVFETYLAAQSYQGADTSVSLNFSTAFPCAWISYLGSAFKASGITPTVTSPLVASCPTVLPIGTLAPIQVAFPRVDNLSVTIVYFNVAVGGIPA